MESFVTSYEQNISATKVHFPRNYDTLLWSWKAALEDLYCDCDVDDNDIVMYAENI